jgi:hypothetical protein
MINCPSCNKEIADDSAHCGYCGQEIKARNEKKTMFGMAALGGDQLEKAIQEAKEAKKAKKDGSGAASGLKIPKPAANPSADKPSSQEPTGPMAAGGLKLPRPGEKSAALKEEDPEDMGLAKTEMLEFTAEKRAELANARPANSPAESTSDAAVSRAPEAEKEAEKETTAPLSDWKLPEGEGPAAERKPAAAQPGFAQPEHSDRQNDFNQPSAGQAIVPAPQAESPLKNKKALLIGIGVVVALAVGGCAVGAIYYLYTLIFG